MKKTLWITVAVLFAKITFADSVYQEDFISAVDQFPASHGSTMVELPGGKVLSCWYAGSKEKGEDVQIYCRERDPVTRFWGAPYVAVAAGERAYGSIFKNRTLGNPSLYYDSQGVLWLFYTAVTVFDGWSAGHVDYKTSGDLGKTWNDSHRFKWFFGNLTRNKPLELAPQRIVLPLYHEFESRSAYSCEIVLDHGEINEWYTDCHSVSGTGFIQPSIIRPDSERMLAYMRVQKDQKWVHVSEFQFKNNYWGFPEPTNLPNPDAAVDAVISADQKILIVYDDSFTNRGPLSLAYSSDGKTFKKIWDFEADAGCDCSYPAIIKTSDGGYHVTYTYHFRSAIKHVYFDEAWLKQRMELAP